MSLNTKELIEALGISRQRLMQYRKGYTLKQDGREYFVEPKLIEGTDWWWDRGKIAYSKGVLKKLKGY